MKKVLIPLATANIDRHPLAIFHGVRETYIQKCIKYGLVPIFISSKQPKAMIDLLYAECRGVLMLGGGDFNPKHYSAKKHRLTVANDPSRDELELYILKKVMRDKKPFLGICRGCQALGIASGGKLHQDIAEIMPQEKHATADYGALLDNPTKHPVIIKKLTRAYSILRKPKIITNSAHHQAIKTVGNGFVISGTSPAGVIEIIESSDQGHFCFGIQGHPEAQSQGVLEPFFRAFSEAM